MELRVWRKNKGLTLEQLSKEIGVAYPTLCRYEKRDRKTINSNIVANIFRITKGEVTPNDLYGYTPEIIEAVKNGKSPA